MFPEVVIEVMVSERVVVPVLESSVVAEVDVPDVPNMVVESMVEVEKRVVVMV